MNHFLQFIFWLSFFALLHTYIFYPKLLKWLAKGRTPHTVFFSEKDDWPIVSIIMSLYNEATVIQEKMETLLQLVYPKDKLRFFIGSDGSDDTTNEILQKLVQQYPFIQFFPFAERRGKPSVLNDLVATSLAQNGTSHHIFILTDANVMLSKEVVKKLVRHFKNDQIAIVDAYIINTGMKDMGISKSENQYISSEWQLKHWEGLLWGKMIGPFGGCYAIRASYFSKVPSHYLVDDFYIAMKAFEKGGQAINDLEAHCYEGITHDMQVEFRRKSRIAAGSYQNLFTFPHLWLPKWNPLNFAFFSHKVLRWWGPFFMLFILGSSVMLAWKGSPFFQFAVLVQLFVYFIIPLLDSILKRRGYQLSSLKNLTYFVMMNVALLYGFVRFVKGIKAGVWERTKRE